MKRFLAVFFVIIYFSEGYKFAYGKNIPATWYIMGVGNNSCGSFIAANASIPFGKSIAMEYDGHHFSSRNYAYAQWMWGYLSGLNDSEPAGVKQIKTDSDAVSLWVENWCKKHPTKTIRDAIGTFSNEERKSK